MFHVATAPLCHYTPLRSGEKMFIAKRFDIETYLRLVEKHQITEGAFVPPMVTAIINSPLSKKYSLKSIRLAHGGAAPLDAWQQAKLKELLHPDCPFAQVWGKFFSPTELEAVLYEHPKIADVGVIGIPVKSIDGELPRAYVVPKPGCEGLTQEDVKAYVAERLAKYKRLDGGVVFLKELPKTASGKKLKRTLREWAAKERKDETRAKL